VVKRRARVGALIGVGAVGVVFAVSLADCAPPTQIQIDVRTDACGVLKNAGIAVSTPERIDTAPLTIFTPERPDNAGCEAKPSDRVGTLIIYPSGAKDAEVGIRIVGGIDRTAEACKAGDYAGCVVARRIERFAEGTTKNVIVILSRACEGKDCGLGAECTESGSCVFNLPDGGTADAGILDAQVLDAAEDAPTDAPEDVVDTGVDACVSCSGTGMTCNAGKCNVDCNAAGAGSCANKAVCAPGLDCTVKCNNTTACQNVSCAAGSKACTFDCSNGNPACKDVTCVAPSCLIACTNGGKCSGTMIFGGIDAGLTCNGGQSCDGVTNATCDGGTCYLNCDPTSCPATKWCDASSCPGDWNQ
jgi:hypothetical protein